MTPTRLSTSRPPDSSVDLRVSSEIYLGRRVSHSTIPDSSSSWSPPDSRRSRHYNTTVRRGRGRPRARVESLGSARLGAAGVHWYTSVILGGSPEIYPLFVVCLFLLVSPRHVGSHSRFSWDSRDLAHITNIPLIDMSWVISKYPKKRRGNKRPTTMSYRIFVNS